MKKKQNTRPPRPLAKIVRESMGKALAGRKAYIEDQLAWYDPTAGEPRPSELAIGMRVYLTRDTLRSLRRVYGTPITSPYFQGDILMADNRIEFIEPTYGIVTELTPCFVTADWYRCNRMIYTRTFSRSAIGW